MKSEFNAGTILYGIPSEGSLSNPCIFLHDGEKTADGYGKVIDVDTVTKKVLSSSGYGNFQWGGTVRMATDREVSMFISAIHNKETIHKY